jgi:hypothetical protein
MREENRLKFEIIDKCPTIPLIASNVIYDKNIYLEYSGLIK